MPLLDRVLVQRIKAETRTAGGIFLPEASVKELNEARVLAVGPGFLDKDGKRVAPSVAAGDRVLIPQVRCISWLRGNADTDELFCSLAVSPSRLAKTSSASSATLSMFYTVHGCSPRY